jgi:pyruvate,orthophosphate dikinase
LLQSARDIPSCKTKVMVMTTSYFYSWGKAGTDGGGEMKNLLGGKGANLAEMYKIGVPVPPGFTVSTEASNAFSKSKGDMPAEFWDELASRMKRLEEDTGRKFGDGKNPLLVSVRSGARISMPGMMDTVLDLGLNDKIVADLKESSGNPAFALDCYRRFMQMYGNVVLNLDSSEFEKRLEAVREEEGVEFDRDISVDGLEKLVVSYKEYIDGRIPEDPMDQLRGAVSAVFESWDNVRAVTYRRLNKISDSWGTAVNVQTMVFGNLENSGSGVAFTRNPATGENKFYGEYLPEAQGEDVVAGIRTPFSVCKEFGGEDSLEVKMPEVYQELLEVREKLEKHYADMQDLEFTIDHGKLFLLQTRTGKRTGHAAVRVAMEMLDEGMIDEKTAVRRVEADQLEQMLHPSISSDKGLEKMGGALAASPGAAVGILVRSAKEAVELAAKGPVILATEETDPNDIEGMHVSQGILTKHGGQTSHAAVVARGMGKPCVSGCGGLQFDDKGLSLNGIRVENGEWMTLDGTTGTIYKGKAELVSGQLDANGKRLLALADGIRALGVKANADTPEDARRAVELGAKGIGLCRTEHMFFGPDRLPIMQDMIDHLDDEENRLKCLAKLGVFQTADFTGILEAMDDMDVIIRLLDPPLHEFAGDDSDMHEVNPMLGHRGCRLAITYPEIYRMQVESVAKASVALHKKGLKPRAHIMIPLVSHARELEILRGQTAEAVAKVLKDEGVELDIPIGTMLETPRACLTTNEVVEWADFFSFGTNDLTQMTFGFSRDDAGTFLPEYVSKKVLPEDPFASLDTVGVGGLVAMAVNKGREIKPGFPIGICGEHGGDPKSIRFCHDTGLDYVSCSPFRVPVARLAAAHAEIDSPRGK